MDTPPDSGQVQNNTAASRFDGELGGSLAVIVYLRDGDTIYDWSQKRDHVQRQYPVESG
jgi:hypothetical protein